VTEEKGRWTYWSYGQSSAPALRAPSSVSVGGSGSTPSFAAPSLFPSFTTFLVSAQFLISSSALSILGFIVMDSTFD